MRKWDFCTFRITRAQFLRKQNLLFWTKIELFDIISIFLLQSECRILLSKHSGENIVLQAVMDEFEENREKGNLTAELLNREKVNSVTKPQACNYCWSRSLKELFGMHWKDLLLCIIGPNR